MTINVLTSVDIEMVYGLDDRVRLPTGARDFPLLYSVQTGSGTHSASYPRGIRGSFSGGIATFMA
jgi:hypothetical protein